MKVTIEVPDGEYCDEPGNECIFWREGYELGQNVIACCQLLPQRPELELKKIGEDGCRIGIFRNLKHKDCPAKPKPKPIHERIAEVCKKSNDAANGVLPPQVCPYCMQCPLGTIVIGVSGGNAGEREPVPIPEGKQAEVLAWLNRVEKRTEEQSRKMRTT